MQIMRFPPLLSDRARNQCLLVQSQAFLIWNDYFEARLMLFDQIYRPLCGFEAILGL
jgi:hypothetical protein